jgi:hypothetical protein
MLSNNIIQFLNFFRLQDYQINQLYGNQLDLINWNFQIDKNIMALSGLQIKDFSKDSEFYEYIKIIAKSQDTDFYPTFLKIIDILNLNELDKQLEKIFLGNPHYHCSN